MSRQLPIPPRALELLSQIPASFCDDGCSRSPDAWFGFDFRWACRIHDWRYCTRAHAAGAMHYGAKVAADYELEQHLRASLPWRWRWAGWIYKAATLFAGGWGAFDSCGTEVGERCRHGLEIPAWMMHVGEP